MLRRIQTITLPTEFGPFLMSAYARTDSDPMPHIILTTSDDIGKHALVRIHSECLTGDLLGSYRCDCGEQLHESLRIIQEQGGVLIYLRQEGRGIGLINKMRAYELQDQGLNTADANLHLGFAADGRSYEDAIAILKDLGIEQITLLTNNPEKIKALDDAGSVEVIGRKPLIIKPRKENDDYLRTKQDVFGHLLDSH